MNYFELEWISLYNEQFVFKGIYIVIQNVFSLFDGSVLKLTVAEYFTPNETKINKEGIVPDIEVELEKVEKEEDFVDTQLNKALEILK